MKKAIITLCAAAAVCACANNTQFTPVLDNTTYTITELNGTEYVPVGEAVPVLIFSEGRVNACLGGNQINACYTEATEGALQLTESAMTKMLVPCELREDEFVEAFNSVVSFKLEEGKLQLINAEGTAVVVAEVCEIVDVEE